MRDGQRLVVGTLLLASALLFGGAQQPANHLRGQSSPYLKRAASQPVDWYPWGAEAFRRARQLDRPILLDVGAVWCSTCDRMDRESYTRPEIAEFINANFVAVKLDYDARPALTAKLERAHALKNFPAGIPLTGFLTPCGKLYLGGTYFPPRAVEDTPGFAETLQQAAEMYRTQRAQIEQDGFDLKLKEELREEKADAGAGAGEPVACRQK
ncbi:MAG: DUF255 domain-containing protein [Terriglobales bacterium]